MKLETIQNKLCCPFDKSNLTLRVITLGTNETVLEGILTCAQCRRIYPIVAGIPIMTPDEFREPALETPLLEKWEKFLDGCRLENFRLLPNEPS